jgi:hypothetical protein
VKSIKNFSDLSKILSDTGIASGEPESWRNPETSAPAWKGFDTLVNRLRTSYSKAWSIPEDRAEIYVLDASNELSESSWSGIHAIAEQLWKARRPPAFEYHSALESGVNVAGFRASCLA